MSKRAGKKSAFKKGDTIKSHGLKKGLLLLLGFICVVICVSSGIFFVRSAKATNQCDGNPDRELYQRSSAAIRDSKTVDLRGISREIKKQKNYRQDVNCLYHLVVNSIDQKKFEEARSYYSEMQTANKRGSLFIDSFKKLGAHTVESVETMIFNAEYNANSESGASVLLF